ncbi:hypothetical protein IAU60_001795 [Kwoniella sp. DSM 27419]
MSVPAADLPLSAEITPAETYQIDSDSYDSDQERDDLEDDEYDKLVTEAENGYSDEEMRYFTRELKENGLVNFLRWYLVPQEGTSEMRSLRKLLLGFGIIPPAGLRNPSTPDILLLGFAKVALSRVLRRRQRLPQYSTLADAISLLKSSKNIIVLSGAGISTSCGIPDFRSSTGLYAQLQEEGHYELDDPQQMFDIHYFKERPEVFYSFAKQIYPSNFVPSPCHRWIKMLEDKGVLLRNYTQNIDTLESLAGVTKVLQCHGSFKTASCLRCKTRVPGANIEPHIMAQKVPYCGLCKAKRQAELDAKAKADTLSKKTKGKGKAKWDNDSMTDETDEWGGGEPGIMKPDITFFGQALDSEFDECLFKDREAVDLLVVIGTSLKVAPVSEVLTHIPHSVPQIYINLTPVHHVQPDICLLGDADSIVTYLSQEIGWVIPPPAAVVDPPSTGLNGSVTPSVKPGATPSRLAVPPDQAEWTPGQGEASHIHLLRRKGQSTLLQPSQPASTGAPVPKPQLVLSPSPSPVSSIASATATEAANGIDNDDTPAEAVVVDEAEGGYDSDIDEDEGESDEQRRAKRARVE